MKAKSTQFFLLFPLFLHACSFFSTTSTTTFQNPMTPHFHNFLLNLLIHTPSIPYIYIYITLHAHHHSYTSLGFFCFLLSLYTYLPPICQPNQIKGTIINMGIEVLIIINSVLLIGFAVAASAGNFNQDFEITWGNDRAKVLNNGQLLTLSLDKASGSGFRSRNEYLFGKIDMQLKLVPGNSAGTVTAYYLSSLGDTHDEIDFEFLGNLSGEPYTLHTNVFTQGKGNREQQFHLWFDPTKDFHTYSLLWNPQSIIFSVDGTPIREFKNWESKGVPFPKNQAMRIYSSLWDAEDWATRGGLVKTDWTQAPFTASYKGFNAQACIWTSSSGSSCSSKQGQSWFTQSLDSTGQARIQWVQKNYMIYNYCTDTKRFPQGLPPECTLA